MCEKKRVSVRDIFSSVKSNITLKCCILLLVTLYQSAASLVNLF